MPVVNFTQAIGLKEAEIPVEKLRPIGHGLMLALLPALVTEDQNLLGLPTSWKIELSSRVRKSYVVIRLNELTYRAVNQ